MRQSDGNGESRADRGKQKLLEANMMKILSFCRNKKAGWEGVIFQESDGRTRITNGVGIWDDSEQRRSSLELVDWIDLSAVCAGLERYALHSPLLECLRQLQDRDNPADREYLSRPLIAGLTCAVSESAIDIRGDSGIIAQATEPGPTLQQKELLAQYQRVLKLAKKHGIKISYRDHLRKRLRTEWQAYQETAQRRTAMFQKLLDQAQVLQIRGIHVGYRDDAAVQKWNGLYEDYRKTFWASSACSRMEQIARTLERLERSLQQEPTSVKQIWL